MKSKHAEPAMAKPSKGEKPQDYEIEDGMRTLLKAEEIKANKHLMPHIHKKLKSHKKAIESIGDLKDRAKEMAQSDNDADD